jgi:hypothetical protein
MLMRGIDNCNADGNTRKKCKYTVETLSYDLTFEMWDETEQYAFCDYVAVCLKLNVDTERESALSGRDTNSRDGY